VATHLENLEKREFKSGQGEVKENTKSQGKFAFACTKVGRLVLRKTIEIVATMPQTPLDNKVHQQDQLQHSPRSPSWI